MCLQSNAQNLLHTANVKENFQIRFVEFLFSLLPKDGRGYVTHFNFLPCLGIPRGHMLCNPISFRLLCAPIAWV